MSYQHHPGLPSSMSMPRPSILPQHTPTLDDTIDLFATKIGLRLDVEACLAYLLLPPVGPVVLLLFESWSDYVRFHACQSAILSAVLLIIHFLIRSSSILTRLMIIADVCLMFRLAYCAWRDAATLDRHKLPVIGQIAGAFVGDD